MAPAATYSLEDEEDDYVPYVSVKKQREALLNKLSSKHGVAGGAPEKRKSDEELQREDEERNGKAQRGNAQTLLMEAQEVKRLQAIQGALPSQVMLRGTIAGPVVLTLSIPQTPPRRTLIASARRRNTSWPLSRRRRRHSAAQRRSQRASSTPSE